MIKGIATLLKRTRTFPQTLREFVFALALGTLLIGALTYLIGLPDTRKLETRSEYLKDRIVDLDKDIAKLNLIQVQINVVASRIHAVNHYNRGRFVALLTLDELAKQTPEDVALTRMQLVNSRIVFEGYANTPATVALFMRNIDVSPLFEKHNLVKLEASKRLFPGRWVEVTNEANGANAYWSGLAQKGEPKTYFLTEASIEQATDSTPDTEYTLPQPPQPDQSSPEETSTFSLAGVLPVLAVLLIPGWLVWRKMAFRVKRLKSLLGGVDAYLAHSRHRLATLRKLKFSDWPYAIRTGLLAGVFLLATGSYWQFVAAPAYEAFGAAKITHEMLKTELKSKARKAAALPLAQEKLSNVDKTFGALLKQLPNRYEMEALLIDIQQAASAHGLAQVQIKVPPTGEIWRDFTAELPIAVSMTGDYHDFGQFLSDVSKLNRITNIEAFDLKPADEPGRLRLNATVTTYRYLDDEEIAKKRRESASKKATEGTR